MHIPDGFLSTPVWATLGAISIPAVGFMARRAQTDLDQRRIPLFGVLGAFVFAAQLINVPVTAGASGHLVGGALLAFTLGPAAASIVMTAILAIQAFLFQDGGVLALGANVVNMAIVGVLAGYLPFYLFGRGRLRPVAIFLGGATSVLASSCLALAQIYLSGVPISATMAGLSIALFLAAATLEGAITLAVVQAIERMNPGWVQQPNPSHLRPMLVLGAIAVLLATFGLSLASADPDSLEKIAQQLGISHRSFQVLPAPMADYEVSAAAPDWLRKAGAGVAGLAVVYCLCILIARFASRKRMH